MMMFFELFLLRKISEFPKKKKKILSKNSSKNIIITIFTSELSYSYSNIYKKCLCDVAKKEEQMFSLFLSDEGPTLETQDFTIRIGSTPTFFYIGEVSYVT